MLYSFHFISYIIRDIDKTMEKDKRVSKPSLIEPVYIRQYR